MVFFFLIANREIPDTDGSIRLELPVGIRTIEAVLKSMVNEWKYQKASGESFEENPNRSLVVKALKAKYHRRLVTLKLSSSLDRGVSCPLRDVYSVEKYAEMMSKLWLDDQHNDLKGVNISTRMSLSLRHQMCLRDQDIRNLDLADCFSVQIERQQKGVVKRYLGLVFSLKTGKTVATGTTQFAVAMRHKEFARCCVGAFAFHLFERFHVK
jgi:hypothetical protein